MDDRLNSQLRDQWWPLELAVQWVRLRRWSGILAVNASDFPILDRMFGANPWDNKATSWLADHGHQEEARLPATELQDALRGGRIKAKGKSAASDELKEIASAEWEAGFPASDRGWGIALRPHEVAHSVNDSTGNVVRNYVQVCRDGLLAAFPSLDRPPFEEPLVPLREALAWIETRQPLAVFAIRGRSQQDTLQRVGDGTLFGLGVPAKFYPEMAEESRQRARIEMGWIGEKVERHAVAALLREVRNDRCAIYGRAPGGDAVEPIPAVQWTSTGGLCLGTNGWELAAFWPHNREPSFIALTVDRGDLLRTFPALQDKGEQGSLRAKRRGRPPSKGLRAEQGIKELRDEGIDVGSMGEKTLARTLRNRGIEVSPRTAGRINKGA